MSKQTNFTLSRRNFLKGSASISALSLGGLSSLALAAKSTPAVDATAQGIMSGDSGIRVIQETLFDREAVTLINQSGKLQMLDARQPISLHQANGVLVVTVNQDDAKAVNGMLVMSPDQRLTFDVKAIGIEVSHDMSNSVDLPALTNLAENQLQIISKHSVFNRIVPVQVV
jgi:hypothetical protein